MSISIRQRDALRDAKQLVNKEYSNLYTWEQSKQRAVEQLTRDAAGEASSEAYRYTMLVIDYIKLL